MREGLLREKASRRDPGDYGSRQSTGAKPGSASNRLFTPGGFLVLFVHIGAVGAFRYAVAGTMVTFDREADGILGCEQKQFAEMADEGQYGYQAQERE